MYCLIIIAQMRLCTLLSCLHYVCLRLIFLFSLLDPLQFWNTSKTDYVVLLILVPFANSRRKINNKNSVLVLFFLFTNSRSFSIARVSAFYLDVSKLHRFGLNGNVLREFHLHLNVPIYIRSWVLCL